VKLSVRYIVHGIRLLEMNSGRAQTLLQPLPYYIPGLSSEARRVHASLKARLAQPRDRVTGYKYTGVVRKILSGHVPYVIYCRCYCRTTWACEFKITIRNRGQGHKSFVLVFSLLLSPNQRKSHIRVCMLIKNRDNYLCNERALV
jgi:hypothetical protein